MAEVLTRKELLERMVYNETDGIFTWTNDHRNGKKGCIVGTTNGNGYRVVRIKGHTYMLHRLAWLYVHGKYPDYQIDHINHDRTDNRVCNLRDVQQVENGKNQSKSTRNTSGVVGVSYDKRSGRWRAMIMVKGRQIDLGSYLLKDDAIKARKEAEAKHGMHPLHGK